VTAPNAEHMVNGYLMRLESELADVPSTRRDEIVDEMRKHIAEERGRLVEETDADLLNLLDRLGEPGVVAAAARPAQIEARSREKRLPVMEILGVILTPIVWPLGILLVWLSDRWTKREKVLATVVWPGGVWTFFVLANLIPRGRTCYGTMQSGRPVITSCSPPQAVTFGLNALLIVVTLLPIAVAIYLAVRLIRTRHSIVDAHAPNRSGIGH
jgi:hypothetical protein